MRASKQCGLQFSLHGQGERLGAAELLHELHASACVVAGGFKQCASTDRCSGARRQVLQLRFGVVGLERSAQFGQHGSIAAASGNLRDELARSTGIAIGQRGTGLRH